MSFGQNLKVFFTTNMVAKLLSLAAAFVLVMYVRQDAIRDVEIRLPVHYNLPADDAILLKQPPDELVLKLHGPWSVLMKQIQKPQQPYVVDLEQVAGNSEYKFNVNSLEEHLGIQGATGIVAVYPPSFTLKLDKIAVKSVKVEPEVKGAPDTYSYVDFTEIQVVPPQVEVRGPASFLATLQSLSTKTVDANGFSGDRDVKVSLDLPEDVGLHVSPSTVLLRIPVREKNGIKALANAPVKVVGCPAGFVCSADPSVFSVRIIGTERLLSGIDRNNVANDVYLDAGGIRAPSGDRNFEVFGPVEPRVQNREGLRYELDPDSRYFKIRLQRRAGQ